MKKVNLNSKPAKYYKNKMKGMTKKESALKAGYSMNTAVQNTNKIEASLVYQEVEKALSIKEELEKKITKAELMDEQVKIIKQDANLGVKQQGIENAQKILEPENNPEREEDKVIIVLKGE